MFLLENKKKWMKEIIQEEKRYKVFKRIGYDTQAL